MQAAAAAASWALSQGPPGGATVVHAGGVLADGLLPSQTLASLRSVFAPKLAGASDNLYLFILDMKVLFIF